MRIVKPLRAGVLTRPYGYRNQNRLGVLVYTLIDFNGDTPRLVPEAELTTRLLPTLDCQGILDLVLPKVHPEFLVSGHAYTAHQSDKTQCVVRAQVGDLEKSLVVFGDRYWLNGKMTQAQPFDSMPITWSHAYGGADFPENPEGKGRAKILTNGVWATPLPNIEPLQERLHHPGQTAAPAGFSPVMINRPRRYRHIGTFSETWMRNEITSFFPDVDRRLFNAAEPDQRWSSRDALPLGAPFAVWNMHAQDPCWTGAIPDWRARCFVRRLDDDGQDRFAEVDLKPTTFWLLPNIKHAVVMYHGSAPVSDTHAQDILGILPAIELAGEPRGIDDYRQIFDDRTQGKTAALYALRDKDLVPKSIMGDWLDTLPYEESAMMRAVKKRTERQQAELRETLAGSGLDPASIMAEPMGPNIPNTAEFLPEMHARLLKLKDDTETQLDAEKEKLRHTLAATLPRDDPQTKALQTLLASKKPVTLPDLNMHDMLAQLDAQQEKLETLWNENKAILENDNDEFSLKKAKQQLDNARPAFGKINLYSAHLTPGGASVDAPTALRKRQLVVSRYEAGQDLCDLDLSGADLSALQLSGANFRGTNLARADLREAVLDNACMDEAILTRSNLDKASLRLATFRKANLGQVTVSHTDFSSAEFYGTIVADSHFAHCDFRHASLNEIILNTKAIFTDCRFDHAQSGKSIYIECAFTRCTFAQAVFSQVVFQLCTLQHTSFEQTQMRSAGFVACQLEHLNFTQARLEGLSFTYKLVSTALSFNATQLKSCCFRGATLSDAGFRDAHIMYSDFSEAVLHRADFSGVVATHTVFKQADLRLATLANADLTGSILQQSDLRGTDLRQANLCTADVSESWLDEASQTQGAYLKHIKLYPLRKQSAVSWEHSLDA